MPYEFNLDVVPHFHWAQVFGSGSSNLPLLELVLVPGLVKRRIYVNVQSVGITNRYEFKLNGWLAGQKTFDMPLVFDDDPTSVAGKELKPIVGAFQQSANILWMFTNAHVLSYPIEVIGAFDLLTLESEYIVNGSVFWRFAVLSEMLWKHR